jgi:hypothetical protein
MTESRYVLPTNIGNTLALKGTVSDHSSAYQLRKKYNIGEEYVNDEDFDMLENNDWIYRALSGEDIDVLSESITCEDIWGAISHIVFTDVSQARSFNKIHRKIECYTELQKLKEQKEQIDQRISELENMLHL